MPEANIFISYARQDGREYAERLDKDLRAAGFRTWRDTRDINEYQDFSAEIEINIQNATHVAVCVTPSIDANPSTFVRREVIYAQSKEKPIIPLIFPNADPPTLVNHLTWIPFFQGKKPGQTLDYGNGLEQLLERLKKGDTGLSHPSVDPYHDYLNALYEQIVYYLNQTVFSLVTLQSEATPSAVEGTPRNVLPMAFFDMAGIESKDKERRQFNNFNQAFEYYDGRILLLGEPGAGKTTTLFAFARDAVATRLADSTRPLPILAPISTWNAEERTTLSAWLAGQISIVQQENIEILIESGNMLLILDGLDELGGERENKETKERYDPRLEFMKQVEAVNKSQVVASCRVKDYAEIGAKLSLKGAITLQPLNDEQMSEYLREMPDLWAVLEADDDLREVSRTPLLLSLFTFAFRDLPEEAKALRNLKGGDVRDKIFATYVKRRYEHEERKLNANLQFKLEEIYKGLGRVAMENAGSEYETENRISYDQFRKALLRKVAVFIELVSRLHIINSVDSSSFTFIHLLMRDYFAYKYAMDEGINSTWVSARSSAIRAIGKLGYPEKDMRAFELLIRALNDESSYIRSQAAIALGSLGDEHAVEKLVVTLRDYDPTVSYSAAQSLLKLGTQQAISVLEEWRNEQTIRQSKRHHRGLED